MEIGSEILDSPQRTLAVSPFVEKAYSTRMQHFQLDGQETDQKNKKDDHNDSHLHTREDTSELNAEAETLGGNSPKADPDPTTREKLKDLHGEYIQKKRATASSQGLRSTQTLRSSSMPRLRTTNILPPAAKTSTQFGKTALGTYSDKKEMRGTDTRAELMKKITAAGGKRTFMSDKVKIIRNFDSSIDKFVE